MATNVYVLICQSAPVLREDGKPWNGLTILKTWAEKPARSDLLSVFNGWSADTAVADLREIAALRAAIAHGALDGGDTFQDEEGRRILLAKCALSAVESTGGPSTEPQEVGIPEAPKKKAARKRKPEVSRRRG